MTKEKICEYFMDIVMQRKVKLMTIFMFLVLIVEKICSGAVAVYRNKEIEFYFSLTREDIICVLIYMATVTLIITEVSYKYIIIPDMILLCVKLYNIVHGIELVCNGMYNISEFYSIVEKVIESIIFATFLIILFIGKLSKGKYLSNFSVICLRILMVCFAFTAIFEVIELVLAVDMHKYPFLIAFDFLKGILNEAFLDMPYFLLVLTLCFTKENIIIKKYNNMKKVAL